MRIFYCLPVDGSATDGDTTDTDNELSARPVSVEDLTVSKREKVPPQKERYYFGQMNETSGIIRKPNEKKVIHSEEKS